MLPRIKLAFFRLSPVLTVGAFFLGGALLSQCSTPREQYSDDPDSLFLQVILPTLKKECEGCHFPGGEVYTLLPFDESRIVLERVDEILLRLDKGARGPLDHWKRLHAPEEP